MAATKLLLGGLMFPEGPRWHDGKLWFSDMHGHKVMTVDLNGRAEADTMFQQATQMTNPTLSSTPC